MILAEILALLCCLCAVRADWTQYVDPFIETEGQGYPGTVVNAGNVFPGAAVPFGVVKFGVDTTEFNTNVDADAGYTPDGYVTGFSMLHESGTGGAPTYGFVSQMPLSSLSGVNVLDNLTYMQSRTSLDVATVGYYKSSLENGIEVELSATRHAGLILYHYPAEGEKHVLVDLSHILPSASEAQHSQFYSNGFLSRSPNGAKYEGYGVYRGGFSSRPDAAVYFCAEFDSVPEEVRFFSGKYTDPYWPNSTNSDAKFTTSSSIIGGHAYYGYAKRIGGIFTFPKNVSTVSSRIGVSFVSSDFACQYLANEIPTWELAPLISAAKEEWNTEVLSKVQTTDLSNSTLISMLYSSLYKMHLMPSDRTGDNPSWETEEPSYDDFYTLWDTFRCLNSYFLLTSPARAAGMIRSLIDIWRFERFMPDARSGNFNGRVQGGSNADNVLADAYVKGLDYGINWTDGYAAMKTNAELVPYNTFDAGDPTGSVKEGRGALPDWLKYGYITLYDGNTGFGRSISRTIEYALNDFSLSQVAKDLAPNDYATYMNRSAGWQYLWQHNLTSLNFTGFLAPLYSNGSREPTYDPTYCGVWCSWSDITYEGLPWEYSWTVPYDMTTLITFMGGPTTTESRLDAMFVPGLQASGGGVGSGNGAGTALFNPGNEASFATPFLYNYLQRKQWKSVMRSHEIINQYYSAGRDGLPGNSDAGALESWLVWSLLGLYPVVTQPVYLLLSPWLKDLNISVAGNKTLRLRAEGLEDGFYVQSARVNGVEWDKSWVSHEDLVDGEGGLIEWQLGSEPVEWDVGELPPSPGHIDLGVRW